jgi:hypothetical protein
MMPIFYQQMGEEGVYEIVPTVPCLELYPEGSENLDPLLTLENMPTGGVYSEWMCPDIDEIMISGDEYAFSFDVVSCQTYADTFKLDSSECVSEAVLNSTMEANSLHANAKFLKQYFNPV